MALLLRLEVQVHSFHHDKDHVYLVVRNFMRPSVVWSTSETIFIRLRENSKNYFQKFFAAKLAGQTSPDKEKKSRKDAKTAKPPVHI